jgi:hypothetical protein
MSRGPFAAQGKLALARAENESKSAFSAFSRGQLLCSRLKVLFQQVSGQAIWCVKDGLLKGCQAVPYGKFHQAGQIVDVKLVHQAAAVGANCLNR